MDSAINTNMPMPPALMQQGLNKIRPTSEIEVTFQRLSSGMRIRSAQEETQSFQVSTRLSPQVRDANSSIRNMNDATGLAQTGLDGLKDVQDNLGRMRNFVVQASSNNATEAERGGYQEQFSKSLQAIDEIVNKTAFQGVKLLDGSFNAQISVNPQESFSFAISNIGTDTLGKQQGTGGQALKEIDISTAEGTEKALAAIGNAMNSIGQATRGFDQLQNTSVSAQDTTFANTQGKKMPIRDTEFAPDPQQTHRQLLAQAALAMSAQANQGRGTVMSLLS